MYRLLIVDDEPLIVEGLAIIIEDNNRWGMDIYKACGSQEALAVLDSVRIDVMITDIRMPDISGIELMRRTHIAWPGCKVIFLTAFDEFEYAYTALKYQNTRYLLKSEDYENILEAVGVFVRELDNELRMQELTMQAAGQTNMIQEMKKREIVYRMMHHRESELRQSDLLAAGINLRLDKKTMLCLSHIECPETDVYERITTIEAVLTNRMPQKCICAPAEIFHTEVCFVIQQTGGEGAEFVSMLADALEDAQRLLGCTASFVLSGKPCKWDMLSHEYNRLKAILHLRVARGGILTDAESHRVNENNILRTSIDKVKLYIDRHLGGDLSLTRLADVARFNPKYLSKLFSDQTGVNLSDYIAQRRCEEAKRLIASGELLMRDIASSVGFFSPAYFSRFFKKMTGLTPQQYKEGQ